MTTDLQRQHELLQDVARMQAEHEARYELLEDYTTLARDVFSLAVKPEKGVIAWFDFDDERWPYRLMAEHLERDNGKDKALFACRGIGKSVLAQTLQGKKIIKDHGHTLRIGSESKVEVTKRSVWLRDQFMRLEPQYGPFRGTGAWEKDRFTVVRAAGGTLDETVTLTSPDSPGTGAHPRAFLLDDPVGDLAEQSQKTMTSGVEWYKRLGSQETKESVTWVVGTFRRGRNIYRYIIENIEGGLRLRKIARGVYLHEGKQFDILVCPDVDEDGEAVFPCHDKEYLAKKLKKIGKAQYKTQFKLQLPGDEDTMFSADSICWGEPPEGVPVRTYIFTDTATSTGKVRHTSMSAIAAISKTPDNKAYVREMKMGYITQKVPTIILELRKKWNAEKIVYENTGPAEAFMVGVRNMAETQGIPDSIRHRMFKVVGRPSDKWYRIDVFLAPHTDAHELHFCSGVKDEILHDDGDGRLLGLLGEQFETYSSGADGSWDGLDLLGDVWGRDKAGTEIFPPPRQRKRHTPPKIGTEEYYKYEARVVQERFGQEAVF